MGLGSGDGGVSGSDSGKRNLILYVYRSDLAIWTNTMIWALEERETEPAIVCLEAFYFNGNTSTRQTHAHSWAPCEAVPGDCVQELDKPYCGALEHEVGMWEGTARISFCLQWRQDVAWKLCNLSLFVDHSDFESINPTVHVALIQGCANIHCDLCDPVMWRYRVQTEASFSLWVILSHSAPPGHLQKP